MSEPPFTRSKGRISEASVVRALRAQGVTSVEELVHQVVAHAEREVDPGTEVGFWVAYNNGKWALAGPDAVAVETEKPL